MTPQQIVGLAVRLFAVWLGVLTLQFIVAALSLNNQPGMPPPGAYLYIAGITVVLALVFWFFPMSVAHRLIPRTKFENVLRVPATEAAVVGCVVVGLWLFAAHVLPALAHFIALAVAMRSNGQPLSMSDEFTVVRLGAIAIEFSVAIILCFKAHAISRFFTAERTLPEGE